LISSCALAPSSLNLNQARETNRFNALIVLLSLGALAEARVIQIPGDESSIQGGIDAASNGDLIQVSPGTYLENINFDGKAIKVASSDGPAVTVIDGGAAGPVVTFASGENGQSILTGFTITNGNSYAAGVDEGGGINIQNSSPTIVGNIITSNFACGGGGGISVTSGSPEIESNTISNNGQQGCFGGAGGGLALTGPVTR
jgi:hypothetical protein